ncbi:MAG: flagellar protein FlaG [Peptostreptococcaceae bacterium]|nr:flagellar protein FlaG [Peptostreptococcaceae bacterium]
MRVEQMTGAGTPYGNASSPKPVKEPAAELPREVFVQVGSENIKIGEYPADSQVRVEESVEHLNRELKSMETNLRFSIHKKTKQIMVKIIDTNTDEVIREIPSEKVLDMVAAMMERAGLFMDKRG